VVVRMSGIIKVREILATKKSPCGAPTPRAVA
jgi:hypothetical protein